MQRMLDDQGPPPNAVEAIAYVELYKDYRAQVVTADGATESLVFENVPTPFYWMVERVFIRSSGTMTAAYVFVRESNDQGLDYSEGADVTTSNPDISDENQPIFLRPNQHLRVRFEGVTVGDQLVARVQFSVRQAVQVSFPQRITVEEAMRLAGVLPGLISVGED